ncbi:MAG: heavy metal translocating P-type ATPase [Thermoguttaceae bacterium]
MALSPHHDRPRTDASLGGDAPKESLCTHCGLPVPRGLVEPSSQEQFCCSGCRTVYQVIHGCGLDRFYRLRQDGDHEKIPARTTDHRYAEFDDPAFVERYHQPLDDSGSRAVELYLEGIHCTACVWLVEKLPQVVPGVVEARLDLRRSLVRVRWNDAQVKLSQVARALDSLGYPPHPARDAASRHVRRQEDHRFLIRLGVAAACAGNVMTLAFALYGGGFTGIEARFSDLFRWTSMGFGLVSLAWPGNLFFRGAWAALRTRTAHLDLPIALALLAGGTAGTINALRGQGEIYFDSLTMLVFLLLLGRWIQRRQQRWAADAVELLFSLVPAVARRVEDGLVRDVPVEAVAPGDLLEVRAGDSIPCDGTVLDGRSAVDQSLLTGESSPVVVAQHDAVHAGTVNLSSRLRMRVDSVGAQTRVGKLMELVEECSRRRPPIVRFADRVAGRFTLAVLALAALTFALWVTRDPARAVEHAVALLIVTCPCALGLATPLAVTVALGRAARRRILIKGGEVLEFLAGRGEIFLDKTGTLTVGRTALVAWHGDPSLKSAAAALECHSAHPIARALVAAVAPGGEELAPHHVADVRQQLGAGISGTVDGRQLVVGSALYLQAHAIPLSPQFEPVLAEAARDGLPHVLVGHDGSCAAMAVFDDPLRPDAASCVARLQRAGWHAAIVSGDHRDVVRHAGRQLGITPEDIHAEASPEHKVALVESAARIGTVVMVGDGVNDAAALSAATVGIAVHGGAEASLAAADVYLNRPGLAAIVELVGASRATLRTIRRCLAISLAYNALAATLAMAGLVGPLAAAILMPISSFTVLALAFLSPTFGDAP